MQTSEVKYTNEQMLALMRDRHIAVTANAGSGKTSVLVEKYLDLLISGNKKKAYDAIRSIVAITFTRQAAADMKAKITKKISDKMLINTENLREWKNLREQISSAKVSTIHSFCNSLLRDYPIEAGISPIFREMDEYESNYYSQVAVDEILERYSDHLDYTANDSAKIVDEFSDLLRSLGIDSLRASLLQIIKEPVVLESLIDFYKQDEDILLNLYIAEFDSHFYKTCQMMADYIRDQIPLINDKNLSEITTLLHDIYSSLNADEFKPVVISKKFLQFKEIKFSRKLSINAIIESGDTENIDTYKQMFQDIVNVSEIYNLDLLKLQIKYTNTFIQLASESYDALNRTKNELAAYTFDDLLILANNLLRQNDVRAKIIDGLDFLMVDEFQDTNQIQYEIVKRLTPGLDNPNAEGPKVFIVGDAKQSIYGFRSADVAVFNQAKLDIQAANDYAIRYNQINNEPIVFGKIKEVDESQAKGDISLADTFRLLPAVALFTNKVCSKLFNVKTSGIKYEPLVCGRKLVEEITDDNVVTSVNGTVSLIVAFKEKKEKPNLIERSHIDDDGNESIELVDESYPSEPELVAKFISNVIAGTTDLKIFDSDSKMYRAPKLKDIAILTRKKSSIQKLTPVFIEKKINFSVVSGQGFYQTQEIIDFLSLLNFIVNQKDDVSLAGALKSPLFNISDGELINIARVNGSYLYEKLLVYSSDDPNSKYFIDRAKQILNDLILSSALLTISELITYTIEITDYFGALEIFDAREQIKSNINLFINMARDFESKGYKSLYEFIIRANSLSENSSEAEAAFISGDNVVSIMTTHASKGLEFPVIILFDTNSRGKATTGMIKSKKHGLSINFKYPIKDNDSKYSMVKHTTILDSFIKNLKNEEEIAEEARLLYVAMTRAKDHLIISGTFNIAKKGLSISKNSFFELIYKTLNLTEQMLTSMDIFSIYDNLDFTNQGTRNLSLGIKIFRDFDDMRQIKESDSNNQELKFNLNSQLFTGAIEPGNRFDIVSATKFTSYLSNIDEFADRYILGLPQNIKSYTQDIHFNDSLNDEVPEIDINANKFDGTIYGTIIHKVFEKINIWFDEVISGKTDALSNIINLALKDNYQLDNTQFYERAFNEAINATKRRIIIDNQHNFIFSDFERELNMPICGSILTGNIDLLLKNKDESIVEVWDWKSNSFSSEEERQSLCQHYEPQIKIYLYLVSKLYPSLDNYIGRLLFTKQSDNDKWVYTISMNNKDIIEFEEELRVKIERIKLF